jgi:hypothetical protein
VFLCADAIGAALVRSLQRSKHQLICGLLAREGDTADRVSAARLMIIPPE